MTNTIYDAAKNILMPFPETKIFLKRLYRGLRTSYLRMRYPNGAFMTCNGAKVYCDFSNENYFWYDGDSEYLDYELKVFTSLFNIRSPDVVLDIGAHWGFYPAFLANTPYAKSISKLVLIEADPYNCNILSKTLARIEHPQVVQVNAAISDKNGYVDLYSGSGTCKQTYCSSDAVPVGKIQGICLDNLIEALLENGEAITHVKLDIDGYEPAFFAGGVKALKKCHPIVMMEFWAKGLIASGCDIEAYWDMLQRNYDLEEACFSGGHLIPLKHKDLSYLIAKTMNGITNIVLIPKVV